MRITVTEPRRHITFAVIVLVTFMCAVFGYAGGAHASDNDNMRITQYDIAYKIGQDGGVDVTESLTIRYDDDSHHGFERYLVTAQGYDKSRHRVYPISQVTVSSPTGAPSQLESKSDGASELLRVGDEDRTVSGTQRYVLKYHQSNVVNKQKNGTTEFFPNALGTQWRIPIDAVTVRVSGPAAITKAKCGFGHGSNERSCQASPGQPATYSASGADRLRGGMTIDAAIPTAAFTSTAPHLVEGPDAEPLGAGGPFSQSTRKELTWAGAGMSVVIPVLTALILMRKRAQGEDEFFDGLPPGALPPSGTQPAISRGPQRQVAVRFDPPQDATPALVGTLIDKRADDRDVAGTIVDLAVRGYLKMEELGGEDWRLTALTPPAHGHLLPYEADLLNALFDGRSSVQLSELKNTFSSDLADAKKGMYREVVERRWFAESPESSRSAGKQLVIPFALLTVAAFLVAKVVHVSPFALCTGFVVGGAMVFWSANSAGPRTALGTAINDQSRGFQLYLKTAEAKQFKFEEAEQIFSRYMPYAVVLGLADRWAKVFADVAHAAAAQGYEMRMPLWYIPQGGPGGWGFGGLGGIESIGSSLNSFAAEASASMSATPGSSGGSGFGGGGGFSGGGFGGGGGGGW